MSPLTGGSASRPWPPEPPSSETAGAQVSEPQAAAAGHTPAAAPLVRERGFWCRGGCSASTHLGAGPRDPVPFQQRCEDIIFCLHQPFCRSSHVGADHIRVCSAYWGLLGVLRIKDFAQSQSLSICPFTCPSIHPHLPICPSTRLPIHLCASSLCLALHVSLVIGLRGAAWTGWGGGGGQSTWVSRSHRDGSLHRC